jgi:hypothetical protein
MQPSAHPRRTEDEEVSGGRIGSAERSLPAGGVRGTSEGAARIRLETDVAVAVAPRPVAVRSARGRSKKKKTAARGRAAFGPCGGPHGSTGSP